ncbi:hypothetical protein [Flavobacterium sp. NRK1]|uniref:hypothetical protein n=1 Tax=Flavobacterium sp. NRK1 TaxID=2954929 RepID=UPI002093BF0A|nr:hypothetical protein [Flavobacterium sp. NRK1]MCO6147394.1 hypothetical protein [Flavobacterium sp. NRK1]
MKELNLPFELGMDYEELELYLGEFNNFLNYIPCRNELLFSMDILNGIIITLSKIQSESITNLLSGLLGNFQTISESEYTLHTYKTGKFTLCVIMIGDEIKIVLSNKIQVIQKLLLSLI